ncbi:MAG: glutamate racemase [Clostridia bacterium]|nr:glutamate racemase [Clostridia bacterium]
MPIGVFDSGLGGLSAVREIRKAAPDEDIIYFGDTARVPYGSRSPETIIKYACDDADFLLGRGVRALVVACGTVSSVALDLLSSRCPVPVIGVVDGAAKAAVGATKNGIIGVIGTTVTVNNGSLEKKTREYASAEGKDIKTVSRACQLFVALVENGFIGRGNAITEMAVRDYLKPIKESGADTLILGCTHFPIIADIISDFLPGVTLINPSEEAVKELYAKTEAYKGGGTTEYFVSDAPANFDMLAEIFLGKKINASVAEIK